VTGILDIETVLITYAASSAICLAVIGPVWYDNRKRIPGLGFWVADYILQFIAMPLIALRGIVPDFVSIVLANTFVIGGTVLLYMGLQRFAGREGIRVHNYVMLALFFSVQTYFTFVAPDMTARNINISAGLLFISVQIAWLMLRRMRPEMRVAARGVGVVMVAYGALSLTRIAVDLAVPSPNDLFRIGLFDTAVILSYEMLFIALTFGLMLILNHRLVVELEGDIIVRELAEERLREMSDHDPLTGLLNSRAFQAAGTDRLAKLGESHASLIYLDLDSLKEANDNYGHPMGDAALVGLAGALTRTFRGSDVVARMGGDEFAVLAISRERDSQDAIVARFSAELARTNRNGTLPFEVSASLGIAAWDGAQGTPDLGALIRIADERMYEAKRKHHALPD
jgi:diguanylate cyclase (GGDEF)-like protein